MPEPEVVVVDPVAPKKPMVNRKKEARKNKGILIVEGTPEARKSPLIPDRDKGKETMHDLSPLSKNKN